MHLSADDLIRAVWLGVEEEVLDPPPSDGWPQRTEANTVGCHAGPDPPAEARTNPE